MGYYKSQVIAEQEADMNTDNPQAISEPVSSTNAIVGGVTTKKLSHHDLILDGVCSHCAHCGQALTDAVSITRGIGPTCSKKGYTEDPVNADEIQALIDLSEYPELIEFLTEHYKPQGVRGLMNGLVKICSLNRKSPVHEACCNAVESLGFHKLASILRESLAVIEVLPSKDDPGYVKVWVKKGSYNYSFTRSLYNISGTRRGFRGTLVPIHDGKECSWDSNRKVTNRKFLWEIIERHFSGLICKTAKGTFKIGQKPKVVKI